MCHLTLTASGLNVASVSEKRLRITFFICLTLPCALRVQGLNMLKSSTFPYLLLLFMIGLWSCQKQDVSVDFEQYLKQQWQLKGEARESFLKNAYQLADSLNSPDGLIRSQFFMGYYFETTHRHARADSTYRLLLDLTQEHGNLEWEVSGLIQLSQVLVFKRSFEEATQALNEALRKAPNQANAELEGFVYSGFGLLYDRQSRIKEAIEAYNKARNIFRHEKNQSRELVMLNYLGIQHAALGLYDLSSQYYLEAAGLALNKKDTGQYVSAIYQSGINLIENQSYREAIDLGKKAFSLHNRSSDQAKHARIINNIGNAYAGLFNQTGIEVYADSAFTFMTRSLEIKREVGDKKGTAFSLFYLGKLMATRNESSALEFYQQARAIWRQANDAVNLVKVDMELARYFGMPRTAQAMAYLDSADRYNQVTGNVKEKIDILDARIRLAGKAGQAKARSAWLNERDSLSEVFAGEVREKAVAATQVRLQTVELTYQNDKLMQENVYQEQVSRLRMWILIAVILAFVVALVMLFFIRNRNRQLGLLNQRMKRLKDSVLHSQANSINLVSSLMNLQERGADSEAEKSLLRQINGRVSALGGITRLLYQEQFRHDGGSTAVNLSDYLHDIIEETLTTLPSEGVDVVPDIATVELSSYKALILGLVTNELIINFFKHAQPLGANRLSLTTTVSEKEVLFFYQDNGPGMPGTSSGKKRFGSFMISSLVMDVKGEIHKSSDKGLYYHIKVPR